MILHGDLKGLKSPILIDLNFSDILKLEIQIEDAFQYYFSTKAESFSKYLF